MDQLTEDLEGLAAGAAVLGLALDGTRCERFTAYAALLLEWNARFNLLGPAAARALWTRHLLDALTLVLALPNRALAAQAHWRVLDVGSGAGLPGIPLQILYPQWQVTLLEVTAKKARFLELARDELGLANMRVIVGRAEETAHDPDEREAYDLCVARAVATTSTLLELTLPFVAPDGGAILYKGLQGLSEELQEAEPARVLLGAAPPTVIPVKLGPDDARCLVRFVKTGRIPDQLPRGVGIPEHQPLDAERAAQIRAMQAPWQGQSERRPPRGRVRR